MAELTAAEEKIAKHKKAYDSALKSIYKIVGFKEIGDYTADDLKLYLSQKYGAAETCYPDCMDYIFYNIPQSNTPISVLSEGYVKDSECSGIFVLPPLCGQTDPKAKKNGAVLIINAVNGKPDSWWAGGNGKGYDIKTELMIFCGRTMEQFLSYYKK
ncbi:MAG: hypothetical protein LUF82_04675 [Clostridia bacterium]|nr:hypothetical protein [Clostridia bacterium]